MSKFVKPKRIQRTHLTHEFVAAAIAEIERLETELSDVRDDDRTAFADLQHKIQYRDESLAANKKQLTEAKEFITKLEAKYAALAERSRKAYFLSLTLLAPGNKFKSLEHGIGVLQGYLAGKDNDPRDTFRPELTDQQKAELFDRRPRY